MALLVECASLLQKVTGWLKTLIASSGSLAWMVWLPVISLLGAICISLVSSLCSKSLVMRCRRGRLVATGRCP